MFKSSSKWHERFLIEGLFHGSWERRYLSIWRGTSPTAKNIVQASNKDFGKWNAYLVTVTLSLTFWISVNMLENSPYLLVQSQQWKHQNDVWNLFKVNDKVNHVVLVSILLTWNTFHTLSWCFYCWLWTSKYRSVKCYV